MPMIRPREGHVMYLIFEWLACHSFGHFGLAMYIVLVLDLNPCELVFKVCLVRSYT